MSKEILNLSSNHPAFQHLRFIASMRDGIQTILIIIQPPLQKKIQSRIFSSSMLTSTSSPAWRNMFFQEGKINLAMECSHFLRNGSKFSRTNVAMFYYFRIVVIEVLAGHTIVNFDVNNYCERIYLESIILNDRYSMLTKMNRNTQFPSIMGILE